MSKLKLENLPFFARFLESQSCEDVTEEEMESVNGGCGFATKKYPSDQEDGGFVTEKYPSDTDEITTDKYPSDSDESGVSF